MCLIEEIRVTVNEFMTMCSSLTAISTTAPVPCAFSETNQTTTATQESQHVIGSQQSFEENRILKTLMQAYIYAEQDQKKETTTITHLDPQMTSYASYLKEMYIHLSQSHISQHWTHLPRCEFVQLA